MRTTNRRFWLSVAGLCVIVLYLLGAFSSYPRSLLPWTATDVKVFDLEVYNLTGDYFYLLKAKITETEFERFVAKLGFVPLTKDADYQGRPYHWSGWNDQTNWWRPSSSPDKSFVPASFRGSRIAIVKYENGFVYYKESGGF